jgi:hypothetical protein
MQSRLTPYLLIFIAVLTLVVSHWIIGRPTSHLSVEAVFTDPTGIKGPASGSRLDILSRSAVSIIDSIRHVEALRPPKGIIRALEDANREVFLRGAIERRGFAMSPNVISMLNRVATARQLYLNHTQKTPEYAILVDAIRRTHGPLVVLDLKSKVTSVLPSTLRREVSYYDPSRVETSEPTIQEVGVSTVILTPDALTFERYYNWLRAIEDYDQGYHRDLIEKAIVAATVYRAATVISAETDSTGVAAFPPFDLGNYWITGHYPRDLYRLSREHRSMLSRSIAGQEPVSGITFWDRAFTHTLLAPRLSLTSKDAVSLEINLP